MERIKIKKIENLKEFIIRTKASKSKIYRFYKTEAELWAETVFKYKKRYFPIDHAKYFDSEIMYYENKKLMQENIAMRNVIDCLADKDSLNNRLWLMEWSFFFTIAYKLERNKTSCFLLMHSLYDNLICHYGEQSEIRLFFTTEPFNNRTGYHNHFVLYVSNKNLQEDIIAFINDYFLSDKVDIKIYDKYQAGLFYIVKNGLVNEDWDILGNRLSVDNKLAMA